MKESTQSCEAERRGEGVGTQRLLVPSRSGSEGSRSDRQMSTVKHKPKCYQLSHIELDGRHGH